MNTNVTIINRKPTEQVSTTSTRMGVKANQSLKLLFLQGKADISVIYDDKTYSQPILGKDIDTEFDLLNQSVSGVTKEITYISVCNINATIAKVNVVIDDGTNSHYILKEIQIKNGETLEYYDTLGWSIKSNASMHIQTVPTFGDMLKAVYDVDDDGVVDNSMALDGHPASDFVIPTGSPTDYLDGEGNPQPFPSLASTDLAYTASPTNGIVTSSTGTDATLPLADVTNAGLFSPSEKSKLASITEIFTTALKTAYDSAVAWISTNGSTLISHLSNTSNPHSVTKTQVGLGNVDNTTDLLKPISTATQSALDLKLDENTAIVGATKTKITYDSKGLVISGADATTADIADSTNKRYITDAQQTILGNTSGTNTGDNATNTLYSGLATSKEDTSNKSTSTSDSASSVKFPVWSAIVSYFDLSRIKTILGISTLSGSNTGDETTSSIQTKRPLKTINGNSLEGTGDITISGGGGGVSANDAIAYAIALG